MMQVAIIILLHCQKHLSISCNNESTGNHNTRRTKSAEATTSRRPSLKDDQVLIKVEATALNITDTLQRRRKYSPPKGESDFPGLECSGPSGLVEKVGNNVSTWNVGDQLASRGISLRDAASFPEVACIVWSTVFMTSKLSSGERLWAKWD